MADSTNPLASGNLKMLPPSPASVRVYFDRWHSSISGLDDVQLAENEQLWAAICGVIKPPPVGEAPADRGALITAATDAPRGPARAHRPTHRSAVVCEGCGAEFPPPRGPASKFCGDCRKAARKQAVAVRMRSRRKAA